MKVLLQQTHDPYFNLAVEEFLFRNGKEEYLYIYRNNPSVIIGKHQNTMAEINHWFINNKKLPVIRRLSGGGTVYHDLGNVNFCFIINGQEGNLVNFLHFNRLIIRFLNQLGLDAFIGEKNDIRIGNHKVSGNAEHILKNRVLHHGTLLYNTDLAVLNEAIRSNEYGYQDRAIRSNRSSTINIADELKMNWSVEEFTNRLVDFLTKELKIDGNLTLTPEMVNDINILVKEKYSKSDWNYGYNANYSFSTNFNGEKITITVENGIITSFNSSGSTGMTIIDDIKKQLIGLPHDFNHLVKAIHNLDINSKKEGFDSENLSKKLI